MPHLVLRAPFSHKQGVLVSPKAFLYAFDQRGSCSAPSMLPKLSIESVNVQCSVEKETTFFPSYTLSKHDIIRSIIIFIISKAIVPL